MTIADALASLFEHGMPFRFTAYDGSEAGDQGSDVHLHLANERGLSYILTAPGDLGMARAYVAGDLQVEGVHPGDPYELMLLAMSRFTLRRPSPGEALSLLKWFGVLMIAAGAIILANIFVTFPLAFGVIKPVFDTMNRSLEEASATIGATRWQTFWHVTLPSLRGAIVSGALLTFARAVGEFGSTILVSGNLAGRTQTAPLYIFAKFNEGQIEAANAIAIVLALFSFLIFSVLFFARDWLDVD